MTSNRLKWLLVANGSEFPDDTLRRSLVDYWTNDKGLTIEDIVGYEPTQMAHDIRNVSDGEIGSQQAANYAKLIRDYYDEKLTQANLTPDEGAIATFIATHKLDEKGATRRSLLEQVAWNEGDDPTRYGTTRDHRNQHLDPVMFELAVERILGP